jgi:hypothetical protein
MSSSIINHQSSSDDILSSFVPSGGLYVITEY